MDSVATETEIQELFQRYLGRPCETSAVETFKALNFTPDQLAVHLMNSAEYGHKAFGVDSAGNTYQITGPANSPPIHPLAPYGRADTFQLLHSFFERMPDLSFELCIDAAPPAAQDIDTAQRIIAAYKLAIEHEASVPAIDRQIGGVWRVVGASHHQKALGLLESADAPALAAYLANGLQSELSYGILSQGHLQSQQAAPLLGRSPETAARYKLLMKDSFVRLAESLGVLPVENPEQGRYGENIHVTLEAMIEAIQAALGTAFDRPHVAGLFGLVCRGKLYDVKATEDAYLADRIARLGASSTIEIGGGFGGLAFQLSRIGVSSSVFDLPVINAIQAFFLIGALGADKVALFGEPRDTATVSVLPWQSFFGAEMAADVVVNRDSMSEFPRDVAYRYCAEIRRRNLPYLSINQEVENDSGDPGVRQVNVGRVAAAAGLTRRSRSPYWLRKGYVEELFE